MIVEGGVFLRAARSHEAAGVSCEDAACIGSRGSWGAAALADGCSSGEDSGFLSRALARATIAAWREENEPGSSLEKLARRGWSRAGAAALECGLEPELSPATLLLAELDAVGGRARFACWGDGAVAIFRGGGLERAWTGESLANMPAYPAYAFEDALWARFEAAGGSCSWSEASAGDGGSPMCREGRGWACEAELQPGDVLVLASDGTGAVEGLSVLEVLEELASARGPGGFMTRRAGKAVDGWIKAGRALGDDFGVAALRWSEVTP